MLAGIFCRSSLRFSAVTTTVSIWAVAAVASRESIAVPPKRASELRARIIFPLRSLRSTAAYPRGASAQMGIP